MKKISFLLSLLVGLTSQLLAQDQWKTYTNKDNVRAMAVQGDKIWIGTDGGVLVRNTNGDILTEYTKDDGLAHNTVTSIAIDSKNNIWIGTWGGVSKFDGRTWTTYNISNSDLVVNEVRAITADSKGNLWVGTVNGISKFDGSTWITYNNSNSGLVHNDVRAITEDSKGNLWFGTYSAGVSKFDGRTWTTYTSSNSGLVYNDVQVITADSKGNIWIGTRSNGISKFDGTIWTSYTIYNAGVVSNYVLAITEDSKGNIWFGTSFGVSKFDGTPRTTYTSSNSGLVANDVLAITEDSKGNIWFGTRYDGVSKFDGTIWTTYNNSNSVLGNNAVQAITEDSKGNLWVGTYNGGVSKFDGSTWTIYNSSNSGLVFNSVDDITEDSKGNIWFGTHGGVSKFDGRTWTTYNSSNSGLVNTSVGSITEDSKGNLWVGTNYGGISKFDGTTWTTYTTSNSGLVDNDVRAITEDSKENLWFGTRGGVSKFDGRTWTIYDHSNSGLYSNLVLAITEDSKGNLWFGTLEGISKFDGTTWKTYFSSNYGLVVYNDVRAITEDSKGNIWFGTYGGGISKFDGTTWTTYTTSNSGLGDNHVQAITEDSKGNIWFGTFRSPSPLSPSGGGISVLLNGNNSTKPQKEVHGRVYFDKNQNNKVDALENGVANQRILIQPSNRTAFTNELGEYSFKGDSGLSYTVSCLPRDFYTLTKDTVYTVNVNSASTLPDFGVFRKDTLLILSNISFGNWRCDQTKTDYFTFTNAGTISANAKVILSLDTDLEIKNSFPTYDSLVNNKLYYSFNDFKDGSTRQVKLELINPDFTRTGDTLVSLSTLKINGQDFTTEQKQIVRCSYDPNDKAVSPLPVSEKNYTLKNQALTYTIRFQNTGNDTAYYVGIKDSLDLNLNWDSFTVLATSHKVHTTLDQNGLILFAFDNIYLPDSTTNEAASHGFVSYSIRPKSGVKDSTIIKNTAYIYFDQNPAVVTNTTENNLVTAFPTVINGVGTYIASNTTNTVMPHPITERSVLRFENKGGSKAVLQVLDMSGKVIFSKTSSNQEFELNKSEFKNSGLYFYQVQTENNTQSGKLLVD